MGKNCILCFVIFCYDLREKTYKQAFITWIEYDVNQGYSLYLKILLFNYKKNDAFVAFFIIWIKFELLRNAFWGFKYSWTRVCTKQR